MTLNVIGAELHDSGGNGPGILAQGGSLTLYKSLVYNIGGPELFVASARVPKVLVTLQTSHLT